MQNFFEELEKISELVSEYNHIAMVIILRFDQNRTLNFQGMSMADLLRYIKSSLIFHIVSNGEGKREQFKTHLIRNNFE